MRWGPEQRVRLGHRLGFAVIATLLLFILVSLPLVISSVTNQLLRLPPCLQLERPLLVCLSIGWAVT